MSEQFMSGPSTTYKNAKAFNAGEGDLTVVIEGITEFVVAPYDGLTIEDVRKVAWAITEAATREHKKEARRLYRESRS